ncbi:DUF2948 family protein [Hyphomonas pacifica]|uniref:DUF2948 domain-containing protein n=1 Tax=Hyphomonas pacifica TaxID=1280941 RepID=A0A062U0G4_9PROT|nr:DUF2948 family protein [Hyphomonas pacifica]MAN46851.1 DUF2948 domain-containing protein [Hyphomonas sp.]MBR9806508.1 DUF2948 family protein [Alphaproteobacteria bacterium]KCZ51213.1 hypothetical protein HY2_12275 [Hyphomonas pacifica]RAN33692.1 hypothetical protein HY3_12375 [Hyphomonas pacifica]RAN35537.1 hypothetical protein HY11_13595 [Hyphomonas pacifica]|tara:strand:+ start:155 stop:607 length:453 start_codon:yes stop_codon:yes gene_type:complete
MADVKPLRLLAESVEDLEVISAAIQDSVVKAENLNYESRHRRFTLELNRYRWESQGKRAKEGERIRSLLAFDGVLKVKTRAVNKADPEMILSLLQVTFTPSQEPPGGTVTLLFAGDGEIALDVEVLDATLLDSDYVWPTRHLPNHERRRR